MKTTGALDRGAADGFLSRFLAGGLETLDKYGLDLAALWLWIDWSEIASNVLFAATVREFGLDDLRQAASYFVYWGRLKTVSDLLDEPQPYLAMSYLAYYGLNRAEVESFRELALTHRLAS